ncbi:hypothetical protein ZIOFF_023088 [Zingiber officinale]|uniref:RING-type E3 ubiquitin transferase n=1 Tax=Zingiber officinale TaxID=94328 RepID=A0A8J5H3T2_ZINOF|nr:hypothetical protein ZIOFF_023088 [Zingiber officinale]
MASVSDVLVVDLLPRFRSSPAIPRPLDMSGFRVSERLPDADFEGRENDWATDDFLIGTPSIEFSRALQIDSEGPRLVGFESDSESDGQQIDLEDCEELDLEGSGDLGLPCRWECLQLGENRGEQNEDFEWEEVDGRIDERDALGVTIIGEEERSEEVRDLVRDERGDQGDGARWEVLLSAYSFGRNEIDSVDVEAYYVDEQDEFVYTSDNEEAYEVLFEHLADHDSDVKCSPASKTVIESLPSVIFTEEDLANDNAVCAVCKDGILVNEIVKRLPCSHLYHKECILPWLEIRNTCPLCRFELPTDSEHEKLKDRRYEELQLSLCDAALIFDDVKHKPVELYHSMLKCHAKYSSLDCALAFYLVIRRAGFRPTVYNFTYLHKVCNDWSDLLSFSCNFSVIDDNRDRQGEVKYIADRL